jgi:hypothetical protein
MLRAFVVAACLLATARAHGQLTWPPSTRHGGNIHIGADCGQGECYWFSNNVEVATPTLPTSMRSMEPEVDGGKFDVYRTSPWWGAVQGLNPVALHSLQRRFINPVITLYEVQPPGF